MSKSTPSAERTDVELLDAGEGRRLERFGPLVVDRPAPTALAWLRDPAPWRRADLRFDPDFGWTSGESDGHFVVIPAPWPVEIAGMTMEVRPTAPGGPGLYPEHEANLTWLEARIAEGRAGSADARPAILNLFAHTGLVTLAAARAGAEIAHVDGARTAIAWARRNAELSGLADRPVRWLVDDAAVFVAREARRGRRYDGIVLDPPSFGHGKGRRWRLQDELPALLKACRQILADDGFVLLTAHTTGMDGDALADAVGGAFGRLGSIQAERLGLESRSGARLDLGWAVRLGSG